MKLLKSDLDQMQERVLSTDKRMVKLSRGMDETLYKARGRGGAYETSREYTKPLRPDKETRFLVPCSPKPVRQTLNG